MLAHFEDLDFFTLLVYLNWLHLFFADYFDSNFSMSEQVLPNLDLSKLPLS